MGALLNGRERFCKWTSICKLTVNRKAMTHAADGGGEVGGCSGTLLLGGLFLGRITRIQH
jgi:hypothetical protein